MVSPAEAWSAEFESAGQVVFPVRRKRLWIRVAFAALLFGNSLWSLIAHIRADDMSGLFAIGRVTSQAAFAYFLAATLWQLATRRPVVTVDHVGIRIGRSTKRSLTWQQIDRVDDPGSMFGFGAFGPRSVRIRPINGHDSMGISIAQDNVLELGELAAWLRALHARQTQLSDG